MDAAVPPEPPPARTSHVPVWLGLFLLPGRHRYWKLIANDEPAHDHA
jgi:hypothetical protein